MSFKPNRITDDFSSSAQLSVEDMETIAAHGFKTILNCRPDAEEGAAQPTSAELQSLAGQHGLAYFHFPVKMGADGKEYVTDVARILQSTPKPILGFCRSGSRATRLYQAASGAAGKKSVMQWLRSKCLITRFWRWCKRKQCASQCCNK